MSQCRGPRNSDVTVTDQFCGAGGSSLGAFKAGLRVRLALNHWKLAIETHNTNFPDTDHDCTDVSAADPRRYPSTDILITSPECTTHSPAGGTRRSEPQRDLFKRQVEDPGMVRSRATAWDVPRFAEYHGYNIVITENVFEFTRWPLFPEWLTVMAKLGYEHRIVSLNSMFCHPTPQSRDRVYVVFWKAGNRKPQLDFMPPAPCPKCEKVVYAVQAWKNARRWGKYRQQYVYACPACRLEVQPYYFAALNALDLTVPGERIGDRVQPLRPRTMERIRFGLEKYGRTALLVRTNMTTESGRVKTIMDPAHTQTASWLDSLVTPAYLRVKTIMDPAHTQTASWLDSLVTPAYLVETTFSHSDKRRPRDVAEATPTQGTQQSTALVSLPFLVNGHMSRRVYDAGKPLATQSASREHDGIVVPPASIIRMRGTADEQIKGSAKGLDAPVDVVSAGGIHHMLVSGAALVSLRSQDNLAYPLSAPLPAQVASCAQQWTLSPQPFLVSYDRTNPPVGVAEPARTITTLERIALVDADAELPEIEDCYFRMLQPREIGAAMAFPGSYIVLGTKRDQVKQYGNAVTPPAMEWLIRQCVASLAPERAA